jgi:hypothetical protein
MDIFKCKRSLLRHILNESLGSLANFLHQNRAEHNITSNPPLKRLKIQPPPLKDIKTSTLTIEGLSWWRSRGHRHPEAQLPSDTAGHSLILRRDWTFWLEKCIDATPLVASLRISGQIHILVFVGSHSGTFSALNADSGTLVWTLKLKDRIERYRANRFQ